jgi:hypothetical protein
MDMIKEASIHVSQFTVSGRGFEMFNGRLSPSLPSILHMNTKLSCLAAFVLAATLLAVGRAEAQGTAFTYQGRLMSAGSSVPNGYYDLTFALYNASSGGSQVGGTITDAAQGVTNGLFTAVLDFGAVFNGTSYWLQIGVRSNGVGSYAPLTPREQVMPTPYAIFAEGANASGLAGTIPSTDLSGNYSNPLTLSNPGNIFDGTFIGSGTGLTGVALLAGGNNFTGNQNISGTVTLGAGSGAGYFTDLTIGPGGYYPGEEHSLNFDDGGSYIGSLIVGYNGTDGYLSVGNLYHSYYKPGTRAFTIFGNGNVNVDPGNWNAGFLNNGNTNGAGLTFGSGSGEGIASKRTAGGNQYGLDFYTGFANRMSLLNSGNLNLNGNDMYLLNGSTDYGTGYRTSVAGLSPSGGHGVFVYGYEVGYLGTRSPDAVALWWDWHNNVAVNGEYLVVNGLTPVYAYLGDDGAGNDVQIGSQKSGVTALAAYNMADNAYMHFYCSSITIEGGADVAEPFKISSADQSESIPAGAVVVIDAQHPGQLRMSSKPYDTHVAGVVSGANGINPGIQMQQQGLLEGGRNVALTGRVYALADTCNGAIEPGDLLTTSDQPGYAMKVIDHARAQGAILGKAMTGLSEGSGMILVLVTLQ